MMKVIASDLRDISRQLGESLESPQVITGSARLHAHDVQISYKAFLNTLRFSEN